MTGFPAVTDEIVDLYDIPGPRYTSYPTVPEWTTRFGPEDYARKLEEAGRADPAAPLSLYVHLPFCRELCMFCGCNIVVAKERSVADRYIRHVTMEIDLASERLGERRRLSQVHWGGGTPTFLGEQQLEALWCEMARRFQPVPDAEIAIEIDPVVTTRDQLAVLRELGFNRLSMGVQDFAPEVQAAISRIQTPDQTRAVLETARSLGFGGINMDLIYGLPFQTPARWQQSLGEIVRLRPDRIAVYSFAYVPDIRKNQRRLPAAALPRGRDKLELFAMAYDAFVTAGYRPIGMDHFALPHDELAKAQECRTLTRNFQGYSVKAATDVVAFGVTGISDVQGAYAQNVRSLAKYYAAVGEDRFATEHGIVLSSDDRRRRSVITRLMCNFWVDLGPDGPAYFERELEALRAHEGEGLVRLDGSQVELTSLGRVFVRNVAMVFDAYLRRGSKRAAYSQTV